MNGGLVLGGETPGHDDTRIDTSTDYCTLDLLSFRLPNPKIALFPHFGNISPEVVALSGTIAK